MDKSKFEKNNSIDFTRLQKELIQCTRGKWSQIQFNNKLNLAKNTIQRWESGLHELSWHHFINIINLRKIDLSIPLKKCYNFDGNYRGHQELISHLIKNQNLNDVAKQLKKSSATLKRWMANNNEPSMIDVFRIMNLVSNNFLDFIDLSFDIANFVSVKKLHQEKKSERQHQYKWPWLALIPRCLELEEYESQKIHPTGWIAKKIGITNSEEERSLKLLTELNIITYENNKYIPTSKYLDSSDPKELWKIMDLIKYWMQKQIEAAESRKSYMQNPNGIPPKGLHYYKVYTCNEKTLNKVRNLCVEFDTQLNILLNDDDNRGNLEQVMVLNLAMHSVLKE